jgi:alanyl-tRNA synthetase
MYEDVNNANASTSEFTALIKQTNYRASSSDLMKLKKHLLVIQKLYHTLMNEAHKKHTASHKSNIKTIPKKLSSSQQIFYCVYDNGDPKVINQALTELANEDKEHAYIFINKTESKLQYVIIANKIFVDRRKFDANQLIKQINSLSNGSGGGRNQFAQGGTNQIDKLNEIINFINSL